MRELLNTTDLDDRLDTKLEEIYLTQQGSDNNPHNFKGNYINSLGIYISQIKASLLKPDEEIFYGEVIFDGQNQERILSNNGHKPVENESIQMIKRGKKAEEIMVLSNLALVVKCAEKYPYQDRLDLIEIGNIALMVAVKRFDYRKGNRFSSYAVPCIKGIMSNLYQNYVFNIAIPRGLQQQLREVKEILRELSIEEIEVYLRNNASKNMLSAFLAQYQVEFDELSLNQNRNSGSHIREIETSILKKLEQEQLQNIIDMLPGINSHIIEMKFGFNGYKPLSFSEIGKRLFIPKSTAFKYYNDALEQILIYLDRDN